MMRSLVALVLVGMAGCVASPGEDPEGRDVRGLFDLGQQMTLSWITESNQDSAEYGAGVAGVGDVNGDGFDDVVVGSRSFDNGSSNEGLAFLYLGSSAGPDTTPAWVTESDQDGAGYGEPVALAGDVNADGYDDVLVGAASADHGSVDEGRASLYLGSSSGLELTASWTFEPDQDGAVLSNAATAGDVNGDGFDDVVVGIPFYDNVAVDEGTVSLFLGSATGLAVAPAWTIEGGAEDVHLGWAVGAAGDVNGDGFDDVVVSATGDAVDPGIVWLFLGSASGLGSVPAVELGTINRNHGFGSSLASADVNGDGYADLVVGAPNAADDKGMAWVYHGSAAGLNTVAAWEIHGGSDKPKLGAEVSSAGDVNGDGFDDVAIGAPDRAIDSDQGGLVSVYLGSPTGLSLLPAFNAASSLSGMLGQGISSGDFNGDGLGDIVTSAIHQTNTEIGEGRAFVFAGCPGVCEQHPAITAPQGTTIPQANLKWTLIGAPARADVVWLYSTSLGSTPIPACPGLSLDLNRPSLIVREKTSFAGSQWADLTVPAEALTGQSMHVQAFFPGSCVISNVATTTFID